MAFVYSNNFGSNGSVTLASPLTDSATVLTVTSTANLPTIPAGDSFAVTLNDAATRSIFEICYCTSIAGANLTVVRGQENTAAQAWGVGDFIFGAVTAGELGGLSQISSATLPLEYVDEVLSIETPIATAYGGTGTDDPALVEGAGIEITGTWPDNTIANTGVLGLNSQTGDVTLSGTGGADVTQPESGTVNVDTSVLVETITSTGRTIAPTRTGQSVNLEIGTGFVGQTVAELFLPTPSQIESGYSVTLPSVLSAGNWFVQMTCIGWGNATGNVTLAGSGGTFASACTLATGDYTRTLFVAGTAVGGQTPGATVSCTGTIGYAGGSTAIFLTITATRTS